MDEQELFKQTMMLKMGLDPANPNDIKEFDNSIQELLQFSENYIKKNIKPTEKKEDVIEQMPLYEKDWTRSIDTSLLTKKIFTNSDALTTENGKKININVANDEPADPTNKKHIIIPTSLQNEDLTPEIIISTGLSNSDNLLDLSTALKLFDKISLTLTDFDIEVKDTVNKLYDERKDLTPQPFITPRHIYTKLYDHGTETNPTEKQLDMIKESMIRLRRKNLGFTAKAQMEEWNKTNTLIEVDSIEPIVNWVPVRMRFKNNMILTGYKILSKPRLNIYAEETGQARTIQQVVKPIGYNTDILTLHIESFLRRRLTLPNKTILYSSLYKELIPADCKNVKKQKLVIRTKVHAYLDLLVKQKILISSYKTYRKCDLEPKKENDKSNKGNKVFYKIEFTPIKTVKKKHKKPVKKK